MKLKKRILKSNFVIGAAALLISLYIKLVYRTTKWRVENYEIYEKYQDKPVFVAFWHGRLLMIGCFAPKNSKMNVLISHHSDGELIAKVQKYFGVSSIRGSSSKGGFKAIRDMLRLKAAGEKIIITPDGPRGPNRKVNAQTIEVIKKMDIPVIPVTFSVTNCKIAGSWDNFMIAKPFGKGVFMVGEPIMPGKAEMLEDKLNELTEEADNVVSSL